MITEDEVLQHLQKWYRARQPGSTATDRANCFVFPHLFILAPNGEMWNFQQHAELHAGWKSEKEDIHILNIQTISENPPRILVNASVYWEAESAQESKKEMAVVTIRWIIEKCSDGELRFVHYHAEQVHRIPTSSTLSW